MAVYIGTKEYKYGKMIMWHMVANTLEELHEMASSCGIVKRHFQDGKRPHYDVCKESKQFAISKGAILVNDRNIIELWRVLTSLKP